MRSPCGVTGHFWHGFIVVKSKQAKKGKKGRILAVSLLRWRRLWQKSVQDWCWGVGPALLVSDGWRYCLGKGCGRRAMSEWVNVDELCFISPLPSPQTKEHLCTYRPIFMIARNVFILFHRSSGASGVAQRKPSELRIKFSASHKFSLFKNKYEAS